MEDWTNIILCTTFRIIIQNDSDNHTNITQHFCIFQFSTSFEQTARSSQSAIIWWHAFILVPVTSISIRTSRIFRVNQNNFLWYKINLNLRFNIKWLLKISGPIRAERQKCHYSSSIGMEFRTSTVVDSKTRLTSKRIFVLDSTTYLNFRVPDSTKSSEKLACALKCYPSD